MGERIVVRAQQEGNQLENMNKTTTIFLGIIGLVAIFVYVSQGTAPVVTPIVLAPIPTPTTTPGDGGQNTKQNTLFAVKAIPKIGNILVAPNGRTLYTYSRDTQASSTCYNDCASLWPAALVDTPDQIRNTDLPGDFDAFLRSDGTYQVTLEGKPLYFYNADTKSGDVNGNGVQKQWSVVLIKLPNTATTTPASSTSKPTSGTATSTPVAPKPAPKGIPLVPAS